MIEEFKAVSHLLNRDLVGLADGNAVVVEKREGGKCVAFFEGTGSHIFLKPFKDRHPVAWFLEKKCADGAFITSDDENGIHVHIVELKSRVSIDDWSSIRRQYDGMFLNVCAFLGFLNIQTIARVTCYLVYTRDEVRLDQTTNPILIKRLGQSGYKTASTDWTSYCVHLPKGVIATLRRKIRSDGHEITFEAV